MLETIEINSKLVPGATVIWLHGVGASGDDFVDLVPLLRFPPEHNIRFVFPHAPIRAVKYIGNTRVRAWFNVTKLSRDFIDDEIGIMESEKLIGQLIMAEIARHIPSQKIVLVGFSQGGAMALHCGLRYPEKLAGILVLSAWLPLTSRVVGESSGAGANQHTPILMLHGVNDDLIPLGWAKESCDYLQSIGYDSKLISYPMHHTVCPEELTAIGSWLGKVLL